MFLYSALFPGLAHDAELAPAYQLLCGSIKVGCRAAIWVSERI